MPDRSHREKTTAPQSAKALSDIPDQEITSELLRILVCPVSRTPLVYDAENGVLVSHAARLAYPIEKGVPILLPEQARPYDVSARRILASDTHKMKNAGKTSDFRKTKRRAQRGRLQEKDEHKEGDSS